MTIGHVGHYMWECVSVCVCAHVLARRVYLVSNRRKGINQFLQAFVPFSHLHGRDINLDFYSSKNPEEAAVTAATWNNRSAVAINSMMWQGKSGLPQVQILDLSERNSNFNTFAVKINGTLNLVLCTLRKTPITASPLASATASSNRLYLSEFQWTKWS